MAITTTIGVNTGPLEQGVGRAKKVLADFYDKSKGQKVQIEVDEDLIARRMNAAVNKANKKAQDQAIRGEIAARGRELGLDLGGVKKTEDDSLIKKVFSLGKMTLAGVAVAAAAHTANQLFDSRNQWRRATARGTVGDPLGKAEAELGRMESINSLPVVGQLTRLFDKMFQISESAQSRIESIKNQQVEGVRIAGLRGGNLAELYAKVRLDNIEQAKKQMEANPSKERIMYGGAADNETRAEREARKSANATAIRGSEEVRYAGRVRTAEIYSMEAATSGMKLDVEARRRAWNGDVQGSFMASKAAEGMQMEAGFNARLAAERDPLLRKEIEAQRQQARTSFAANAGMDWQMMVMQQPTAEVMSARDVGAVGQLGEFYTKLGQQGGQDIQQAMLSHLERISAALENGMPLR